MTEPNYVTLATSEKRREAANAYALAVGSLSIAWNYFHGALGDLFALVIGGHAELVLAAWRSNENDRAQREMLRAAIKAASPTRWKQTPKARADLLWVLGRADEQLSDGRNDAIHVLVSLHIGAGDVEMNVAMPPRSKREWKLFERRAGGRKLLDEFAKCEQDVDALSVFVRGATRALAEPDRHEWPPPPKQILASPKARKGQNEERKGAARRG
jgi:hypothetical protein